MKPFTKTTKAQDKTIAKLTKKYGCKEHLSSLEPELGIYYFATAFGNGYAYIERNGKQYNL